MNSHQKTGLWRAEGGSRRDSPCDAPPEMQTSETLSVREPARRQVLSPFGTRVQTPRPHKPAVLAAAQCTRCHQREARPGPVQGHSCSRKAWRPVSPTVLPKSNSRRHGLTWCSLQITTTVPGAGPGGDGGFAGRVGVPGGGLTHHPIGLWNVL